jgi:UDP-N-acetylglucosamine 2-epimerase (non-hydrolysing)
VNEEFIVITGNTVIDALFLAQDKLKQYEDGEIKQLKKILNFNQKIILVTGHRRENFGQGLINICNAIKNIALQYKNVQIIYPVHLNPNVKKPVYELLSEFNNVKLISPLSYPAFIWLMERSCLILTDSGGVQEEAPSFGKPVLLMRETTERPEAVEAGVVKLVGANYEKIIKNVFLCLENNSVVNEGKINPYGDGKACKRIVEFISVYLGLL